jgi:exodeoxyribonuclease VII large subunit
MIGKIYTVSEVNHEIKKLFEDNEEFWDIWVRGEISNCKLHTSGHFYFTLKDEKSNLKAVMFRYHYTKLQFNPNNGMGVLVRGQISVYEQGGQYQLYAEEIIPDGIGSMHTAFLQLKEKLEKEGLFDSCKKKKIPLLPKKIGVVTSPTGAALRDIITVITRRFPQMGIRIAPTLVQGEEAPKNIAAAIERLNRFDDIDVIIVGRGGGSMEELWAFNSEIVARAVFNSRIPVISAVGHETDVTIIDFVSDLRAPTPSAAAELAVCDYRELINTLRSLSQRQQIAMQRAVDAAAEKLNDCEKRLQRSDPRRILREKEQQVDEKNYRMQMILAAKLDKHKGELKALLGKLNALSPMCTLERGYAICKKGEQVIKSPQDVAIGDEIDVLFSQGKIFCLVQRKDEGVDGRRKGV